MLSFSHTLHSTARLFLLKSLFVDKKIPKNLQKKSEKFLFITDNNSDFFAMKNFAKIFGEYFHEISSIGDLLAESKNSSKISFLHTDIFRTEGNLHHIKKTQSLEITRNSTISSEEIIKKLLNFGYSYSEYSGESFAYKKE